MFFFLSVAMLLQGLLSEGPSAVCLQGVEEGT